MIFATEHTNFLKYIKNSAPSHRGVGPYGPEAAPARLSLWRDKIIFVSACVCVYLRQNKYIFSAPSAYSALARQSLWRGKKFCKHKSKGITNGK